MTANPLHDLLRAPSAGAVLGLLLIAAPTGATDTAPQAAAAPGVSAAVLEEGEALYRRNCRFCHGTKGTSGKRLAGNEMIADAEYVAQVILTGPGYMTAFAEHLSDAEIATITTYVRYSWGHAYGPMESGEVSALR